MSPSQDSEYRLTELSRHLADLTDVLADSKDRLIEIEETVERIMLERTEHAREMIALKKEVESLGDSLKVTSTRPLLQLTKRVEACEKKASLLHGWFNGLQNMLRTRLSEPSREAANG